MEPHDRLYLLWSWSLFVILSLSLFLPTLSLPLLAGVHSLSNKYDLKEKKKKNTEEAPGG